MQIKQGAVSSETLSHSSSQLVPNMFNGTFFFFTLSEFGYIMGSGNASGVTCYI